MDICVAEDAFPRFDLRAPRCWRSHRRMVSRPISIPMSRRPPTNDSTEAPARLNRSNSSRCGSNRTVAWLRGCRACATAWASVVGGVATDGEWPGNDMGASGSLYAWWSGGARGAPGAHSKRIRLDVGVLPYFFVLFLLGESVHSLCSFIGWFIRLIDFLDFVFGVLVESVSLRFGFPSFSVHFSNEITLGSFDPSLFVGGGGC